jgi:hypothetical protein
VILVPIRTGRGQNDRGHWRTKHRRTKNQGTAVAWVLTRATKPQIPCSVLLTRVAPSNGLDSDNLVGSMKAIRDAVAAWLGVDDRHVQLVSYRYDQRRGPWGVEIRFEPMAGTPAGTSGAGNVPTAGAPSGALEHSVEQGCAA